MPLPGAWSQIPVIGTFIGFDGLPVAGHIIFTSTQVVTVGGVVAVPLRKVATLDVNGTMPAGFALPSTNDPDLSAGGWTYLVKEYYPDSRGSYRIAVPFDAGSIDLATVTRLPV